LLEKWPGTAASSPGQVRTSEGDANVEDVSKRLEAAQAANPRKRLYVVDSPAGTLILGTPIRANYLLYLTMAMSDEASEKVQARETILKACAVDPPPEAYAQILEDFPGLPGNPEVLAAISKAAGVAKDTLAKK
jgi:hypothetical protein